MISEDEVEVVVVENDKGIKAVVKEMLNFKLLFNPLFFLIGVSNAVGMIGFYTPFVYLPSMAAKYVRKNCKNLENYLTIHCRIV